MKKLALFFILLNLIQTNSFAKSGLLADLPIAEIEKYNSLPPDIQAEALRNLKKIGNYDPERMHLDKTGHFFVVDDSIEKIMADNGMDIPLDPPPIPKKIIFDIPPSGYTPEGVPIYHSLPGSPNVIYLNFVGADIVGKAWNDVYNLPLLKAKPYTPAAYNPNQTPGFPPAVQQAIGSIWKRVAEDYAPWQIDVTTEAPASYTPTTAVALITQNVTSDGIGMPSPTAGGIAFLDTFRFFDATYYSPALIYYNNLGGGREDFVAEVVSHEIGHGFGLTHEGTLSGVTYYMGAGSGEISWGCIMGAAYNRNVAKFCNGDYPDANNQEDQVAIINEYLPLRNISAGNSVSTATPLTLTNGTFKFSGIVENYTTSNVFSFNNISGNININATPYRSAAGTLGNNLCIGLVLYNTSGIAIATSNNPQTCSATLAVNSLPLGNYYILVYPVGKPEAPFSVYGIMGQYDLAGTITSKTLILKPQFTTLALNSTMSFDVNDTVRVVGGAPPYTFKAELNPMTQSGDTFTYSATKPGLDTITVTDVLGNIATARVTSSQVDFGGMYGYSWAGNFPNPLTGRFSCPSGYTSSLILGTFNVDYPLYFCYKLHANGVPARFDFGGIYSGSGTGARVNPVTGGATCPTGYRASQVLGESTHRVDYPVFFCYKTHNEAIPEAASFAGMYGYGCPKSYPNPITRGFSCPPGSIKTSMLGTPSVDYPFFVCTYPKESLKASSSLNSDVTY